MPAKKTRRGAKSSGGLLATDRPDPGAAVKPRPILAGVARARRVAYRVPVFTRCSAIPACPICPTPIAPRSAPSPRHQMPTDLNKAVADLEAKLKANPDNLEGWILLGRTEAMRQHWEKSAEAMRQAMLLAPKRPDIATAYGEMQIMADGGLVTPQARDAFVAALKEEPKDLRALWYLGLEAVQQRKVGMARDYWRKLLALLPADGEEHKSVAEALATLDKAEKAAKDAAPSN